MHEGCSDLLNAQAIMIIVILSLAFHYMVLPMPIKFDR